MSAFLKSLLFLLLLVSKPLFASFEIAEVMPNTSDDSNLEYITLKNIQHTPQSLSGYTLKDASGKVYTFTGILLAGGERKQFFRPETKIILNNTDETLSLFSATRTKIDEISYKTSTKGVFLSFEDIDGDGDENIISDERTISGEIYISDEIIIPPKDDSQDTSGNNTPTPQAPEVIFQLQRPSYITQSGSSDIYICDVSQTECKVNFDLSPSFTSDFPAKDYRCELDFWLGVFTWEEQKCNPNTVIFPVWTTQVSFRIIHKYDASVIQEKHFSIFSKKKETTQALSWISGPSGGESVLESPRIYILDPLIEIQSGVTWLWTNFFCEKALCKVNLKYKKMHSLERCFWDFWAGETSSESTRKTCNPGVVTFWPGVHELSLRVYESSRESNEKQVRFFVHNTFLTEVQKDEIQVIFQEQESKHILVSMHLQGKITKEKILWEKDILCQGVEKCFVNFEAIFHEKPEKGRDLKYIWKQDGEIFLQKQNPPWIWIETGIHEILLEVFEGENLLSSERWNIEVSWKLPKQEKIGRETTSDESETLSFSGRVYDGIVLWNILPNPIGNDLKEFIEIRNTSSELRMLWGCILQDSSKKFKLPDEFLEAWKSRYFFNPESKISLGNSKDTITLSCNGEVFWQQSYERKIKDNELLSGVIFPWFTLSEIQNYVPEMMRQVYLEKSTTLKFTILKRDGLKIYGTTFPHTKIELISNEKIFFTLYSDAQGSFLLKTKSIFAGEYHFDVRLIQGTSSLVLPDFKTLSLSSLQRASWFQKAKRKSTAKTPASPKLLVSREIPPNILPNEAQLSLNEKLLFLFLLCMVGCMALGHIFFLVFPRKNIFLLQKSALSFSVRQKIILLGV